MASLVEQIYMQAQGGSAGGAGFADFLVQGRQVNQRQQQIELQKQQVAAELAQLPLKQTLLQQDAQMNALKIQDVLEQRQFAIEDEKTVSTAWEWVSRDLKDKNPAGALTTWMDFAGQLPRLTQNPKFLQLRKDIETSLNIATELAKIKPPTPEIPLGTVTMVENPEDKTRTPFVRTGPGSITRLDPTESVTEIKTPDGTVVRQSTGRSGSTGSLTGQQSSTVAEAEKKLSANENSLALIQESLADINPSTVGPVGVVGEMVETAANIVRPGSMGTKVTEARQKFRMAAQRQYASLKADSQINIMEADAMKDIVDITKLAMSDPTAKAKYEILKDLTALQSVLLSHQMGKFAPDSALRAMSLRQAAKDWKRGNLTDAEIERWNELNGVVK